MTYFVLFIVEIVSTERRSGDRNTLFVTWRQLPPQKKTVITDITTNNQQEITTKTPQEITTPVRDFHESFQLSTSRAVSWLIGQDSRYPLMYSTLEVGTSKEEFLEELFRVVKC